MQVTKIKIDIETDTNQHFWFSMSEKDLSIMACSMAVLAALSSVQAFAVIGDENGQVNINEALGALNDVCNVSELTSLLQRLIDFMADRGFQ